jgi:hypothetical protein
MTIFLNAASLNGALTASERALDRAISDKAPAPEQSFAWCSLAEMAVRRGDNSKAEQRFQHAIALDSGNSYTLAACSDLLLATGRPQEVLALIPSDTTSEALLTRRTLALHRRSTDLEAQLKASGHFRELALLELDSHLTESALASAQINWQNQKEPIDAILLLRAALAAHVFNAAAPALQWLATTHVEDQRIQPLLAALQTHS